MKKSYTSTDINQKQGQELSKKLYRTIGEHAKRLDDARSCARNIGDLFSPNLQVQRRKFCDYCERLIFSDPILYGKKGEELLWRKGYYDVVSTAKKLKKNEYLPDEICIIQAHIYAGIGFYHHLISRLQCEFSLKLNSVIDFAILSSTERKSTEVDIECQEWASQSLHQCLIYLGDLSRYKLEIYPNWDTILVLRYYLQAISYKPDNGMPHNQMGTLAMSQNQFLDAAYHYLRCLACQYPFEGTINNLHNLFDKNSKYIEQLPDENADCILEPGKIENVKRFLARFLLLIDIWYFNKKVSKIYNLCHQTYKNLQECLTYLKPPISESGDTPTDSDSIETDSTLNPSYLTTDILFKLIVICLLLISKLQNSNSHQLSTVIAFTLAIYSQLVQTITNNIQENIMNYPLTESRHEPINGFANGVIKSKKKNKLKFRRRKALKADSEESDLSDNDNHEYSSSEDSFISDNEDILANSSEDEAEVKVSDESVCESLMENGVSTQSNETEVVCDPGTDDNKTKEEVIKKMRLMDVNDVLEIIAEQGSIQSIKIVNDWLKLNPDILKSCSANTGNLLRQTAFLLNLTNINLKSHKITGCNLTDITKKGIKIPLPEDVILKGVDLFTTSHAELDWHYIEKHGLNAKEETIVRNMKIFSFGQFLTTIKETGISYDEEENVFLCNCYSNEEENKLPTAILEELELQDTENGSTIKQSYENKNSESKGQLTKMKHMGQLWLAAEVRALETRVKGKTSLSPYLVIDADALIKYTFMVKHLVYSRKFIVLVPTAVVSALDDLKREKLEARDAIRWLESQFHKGNRFFRAQRPQERAPIPFIKYPKKKDKEMHIYIQIIECCHFLAEQQQGATNVVTLLIGNQNILSNGENKEFSYVGLAKSAGVAIESISQFYGKWKKAKGKR